MKIDRILLIELARRYRTTILLLLAASVLLNTLVFAGSLYMLLVYDTVLPSHNIASLVGLFVLVAMVYGFQTIFEALRSEALLSLANNVHDDLYDSVHRVTVTRPLQARPDGGDGMQPVRDLDAIHSFLSGSGPVAFIDLPWVIVFLIVLSVLHWWLGLTALAGVLVLAAISYRSNIKSSANARELSGMTGQRSAATLTEIRMSETAWAMGMQERLSGRTRFWEQHYVAAQSALSRTVARHGGAGRTFRIFLQSLILTVGALLVIDGKASGGVILASSVLSGRALAPVDQAIANWRGFVVASAGWKRIVEAVCTNPPKAEREVSLPLPSGDLVLRELTSGPPGSNMATIAGVSLELKPGQAVAVIGPSAAGKSSLAKAMLGIWKPLRGEVRLDGATLDQWDREQIGAAIGYVPQSVDLSEGTIAQNIARFDAKATSEAVIAAAQVAGMHETILAMPNGYETTLSAGAQELSAGQRQRIGLARALFGDPFLVVLDEANSNLDAEGDAALTAAVLAVRKRMGIVVMITHRSATLGPISHVAVLRGGRLVDFGERDEVLGRMNPAAIGPRVVARPARTKGNVA